MTSSRGDSAQSYLAELARKPEFLAKFSEEDLTAYLEHLMELDLQELAVCS